MRVDWQNEHSYHFYASSWTRGLFSYTFFTGRLLEAMCIPTAWLCWFTTTPSEEPPICEPHIAILRWGRRQCWFICNIIHSTIVSLLNTHSSVNLVISSRHDTIRTERRRHSQSCSHFTYPIQPQFLLSYLASQTTIIDYTVCSFLWLCHRVQSRLSVIMWRVGRKWSPGKGFLPRVFVLTWEIDIEI